jgi:hypothetical protein
MTPVFAGWDLSAVAPELNLSHGYVCMAQAGVGQPSITTTDSFLSHMNVNRSQNNWLPTDNAQLAPYVASAWTT